MKLLKYVLTKEGRVLCEYVTQHDCYYYWNTLEECFSDDMVITVFPSYEQAEEFKKDSIHLGSGEIEDFNLCNIDVMKISIE